METLILIDDRNGHVVPFKLNLAQQILYNGLTGRDLILKAGQLGITTFFAGRGFKKVITQPNTTAVLVAHEEYLTQRLLSRVEAMYNRLPLPEHLKPKMHHNSSYEKTFPSLNSVFYIGTAGAKVFGRGEAINYFIGSEVAFWPDPDKILIPTMQRVPLEGEMVLESTPNGEGTPRLPNVFKRMVDEALEGDGIWKLHALPWWVEPEYKIAKGSVYALERDRGDIKLTQEEEDLCRKAKWDDIEAYERIRWRRRKIHEMKSAFWQEMLEDIATCFLTVAEPFYDSEYLQRRGNACYEPDEYNVDGAKIWFPPANPEEHPFYTMSIDPGQGKATKSVCQVWRHDLDDFSRTRHEATLSGLYDHKAFYPMCKRLGEQYYYCQMIPEANGHGLAFTGEAADDYPNLYMRTDIVSGVESRQIGWYTSGAARIGAAGTKVYAMSQLQTMLPNIETYDGDLIRELRQVRYSGDNIVFMGANDHHDAAMIMAATRPNMGGAAQIKGFGGVSGWSDGWGQRR
jgi:hypothetical protein